MTSQAPQGALPARPSAPQPSARTGGEGGWGGVSSTAAAAAAARGAATEGNSKLRAPSWPACRRTSCARSLMKASNSSPSRTSASAGPWSRFCRGGGAGAGEPRVVSADDNAFSPPPPIRSGWPKGLTRPPLPPSACAAKAPGRSQQASKPASQQASKPASQQASKPAQPPCRGEPPAAGAPPSPRTRAAARRAAGGGRGWPRPPPAAQTTEPPGRARPAAPRPWRWRVPACAADEGGGGGGGGVAEGRGGRVPPGCSLRRQQQRQAAEAASSGSSGPHLTLSAAQLRSVPRPLPSLPGTPPSRAQAACASRQRWLARNCCSTCGAR
jgi:hypothetical protein